MRAQQSEKALRSALCHSNCWWQSPTICVSCKAAISHCILSDSQAIISKADNRQQGIKRLDNKCCLEQLCIRRAQQRQIHLWFRTGVLLYIQKQRFCWYQAQAWPEKLKRWTMSTKRYFAYPVQRQTDVSIKYSVALCEWKEADPICWHTMHLQLWNPLKVTRPTAHLYSCHIYICMTSIQPYQKYVSCSRQTYTP